MEKFQINFVSPTNSEELQKSIKQNFNEALLFKQKSFSGFEIITVLITTSAIYLDKILNFFIQNRKNSKETSIKISDKEIVLNGYTNKEIQEIIQSGSLEYFNKLLSNDEK